MALGPTTITKVRKAAENAASLTSAIKDAHSAACNEPSQLLEMLLLEVSGDAARLESRLKDIASRIEKEGAEPG